MVELFVYYRGAVNLQGIIDQYLGCNGFIVERPNLYTCLGDEVFFNPREGIVMIKVKNPNGEDKRFVKGLLDSIDRIKITDAGSREVILDF